MMTDPIADMLTRIRNAILVKKEYVDIPGSKMKRKIAEILKSEGFIEDFQWVDDKKQGILRIYLKYWGPKNVSVIRGLERVSKPGRRIYMKAEQIPRVFSGTGIFIVSTHKGLMVDREARKRKIGGEIICKIW